LPSLRGPTTDAGSLHSQPQTVYLKLILLWNYPLSS
jgi:hypothetical protein